MAKTTRHQIAAAIQAGIPHLWNGRSNLYLSEKSDFVCFAIERGFGRWDASVSAAQKMIAKRIKPYATVEEWLRHKGVKGITNRKLQAYRTAWMKSLIEEFSK